ncbi:phage tail protein [uncultured Desulfovibrio sp.]|uniref:phage tail protein n=1 Tax=uncultured Desulfovibrio sp. TaxID=167968 RepID=UPI00266B51B2|nr:phage tail protein [uncultured Desulfovibrio sp.]
MSTILTAAGESLIARLQAEGKALIIDTMILANVPGQDHTQGIAPGVTVPDAQVVLRYPIPPEYRAYVNPNQVVYSAMLGSDMGDFTFNWQGLWCSEHNTLVAVATFPALEKRKYDEANGKTGNNLTRNFLLTFTGARELTGLTISADVWQLDFTVRLNGIDERERLSNFDVYGQAFFDDQGWLLQKTPEAYAFAPGLGYVGGIRAALAESLPLAAPESANLPQNVWLDVCLKPTGSDRIAEASPMLTPPAAPLADSAADETGLMHYRALVARIEADGSVTDLRPRKTSGALPIPDVATPEVAGTMRPDDVTCHMDEDLLKVSGRYAICGTAGATAAKAASLDHFALVPGAMVQVVFSNVNTAANPTLNVNGTGAKPIRYCGGAVVPSSLAANQVYTMIYDGAAWQVQGGIAPAPTSRKVLTSSGTYAPTHSVWARVTVIGGGGGGGKGGGRVGISDPAGGGGGQGGTSNFGGLAAAGGSGGAGGQTADGGGGGGPGDITIGYVYLTTGQSVSYVVGAGGAGGTGTYANTQANWPYIAGGGPKGGVVYKGNNPGCGGIGAFGASSGGGRTGTDVQNAGSGGSGGISGYGYGDGGGGGGGTAGSSGGGWGSGGRGATDGDPGTNYASGKYGGNGGNGGAGAVILELYGG